MSDLNNTKVVSSPGNNLTNWFVLTGAPCSGKTTTLNELKRNGFRTTHEVARAFIERELARGLSLAQIRTPEAEFQRKLIEQKRTLEDSLPQSEIVLLDRAMPDSITYLKRVGIDPASIVSDCLKYRYAGIFLLKRLPFLGDDARIEDEQIAQYLEQELLADYTALGYQVISIPVLPIVERVKLIQDHISALTKRPGTN